jgi:superfamily II DNA/RNA helicase
MSFSKFELLPELNQYFKEMQFKAPTEVQKKVIPALMQDDSLLVTAQTGSGKTLAFALPICHQVKLLENAFGATTKKGTPLALIIAPTKELASQIHGVFKDLSHHVKIRPRLITGGMKNETLLKTAKQSFEVLIATPNKVNTAIQKKLLKLSDLKYLVFDEADTLFEMGFKKDIEALLGRVKLDRVETSFFTATLPTQVEVFINDKFSQKNLKRITTKDAHQVQQKISTFNLFVSPAEKLEMIGAFLKQTAKGRGIIFANQKNQVDDISKYLSTNFPKLKFMSLHGDMPAKDRMNVHKIFKDNKAQVLVATDVAARGIDIKDLVWVLNYNLPRNAEFYLHRAGRTGRMGKKGIVYNLVTERDARLVSLINDTIKKQTSLKLDDIAASMERVRQKSAVKKSAKKKLKKKRIKVTKRTRL